MFFRVSRREALSISTISFDAAALLISVALLFFTLSDKIQRRTERSIFLLMILNNIVSCTCNLADYYLWHSAIHSGDAVHANFARTVCDEVFFTSQIMLAPLYAWYLVSLTGAQHVIKKYWQVLLMLPVAFMAGAILTNTWHKGFFYLDEYASYHRGPLIIYVYVEVFLYIIFGCGFLICYGKKIHVRKQITLLCSIVFAGVASLIQYEYSWIKVELLGITIAYMAVFLFVEYARNEYDPICRCYNRYGFITEVKKMLATGQNYRLVSFRLNNISEYEKVIEVEQLQELMEVIVSFIRSLGPMNKIYTCDRGQFVVVLHNNDAKYADWFKTQLVERLQWGWRVQDQELDFQISISNFVIPKDFSDLRDIMNIVTRRYGKKEHQISFFEGDDLKFLARERYIENLLEESIEKRTFEVWFQPIYSVKEKKFVAAEALSRLRDRDGSLISPGEFIPIAEKSAVIKKLGRYVLEEACRAFKEHDLFAKGIRYIEINVAQKQLYDLNLCREFKEIVEDYGLPMSCINLEITETVAEDESKRVRTVLAGLKEIGFSFSLDDFGTGYSNMSRLFNREFYNIKLDRSLLVKAEKNESASRFLEALPGIVHSMNAKIIQEGVETKEQLDYVRRMEGDMIQGFYFSKPLPMEEFANLLEI